jgi:hypothetical protein
MGIERMFMKKIKNQQVFGEMVNYFYLKYLSPIILIGLIVLLYFLALYVSSISALMPFFCWGLILLCLYLFLLSILIPKNIIIYDEYNRVLIIRGGKTAFSYLRKRIVPLNLIESVTGKNYELQLKSKGLIALLIEAHKKNRDTGLHIAYNNQTLIIKNVKQPVLVANEIHQLL